MNVWHRTEGGGPPLLLLHGWGMNAGVWEPLMPALRARFAVTRVELPGHGASAPPEHADLAAWATAVRAVAPPRAHWVGWSLGALVAQQAALDAPQAVETLSLVAGTPRFVQGEDWPCAMPRATFEQFAAALASDRAGTLRRFLALQVRGSEQARDTLRALDAALDARPAARPEGLAQGLSLLLESDLRADWARLPAPPRLLLGARDTLVPAALAEALPAWRADAQITLLQGAGHAPFLSHPQDFLDWLEAA